MRVHSKEIRACTHLKTTLFLFPLPIQTLVNNVGTLYTFCPLTPRATEWIDEHVQDNALWFGHALIVEHRYAWALAQGMKDEGLVLA
jgi:hypothetical protein